MGGLIKGLMDNHAQNKANEAQAKAAQAQAEELTRQSEAFEEISEDRLAEMEAQRLAGLQEAEFQQDLATVQGQRQMGSARAGAGASGLGGVSRTSVLDQMQGDIDLALGQMQVRIDEADRAATEAIALQAASDEETIRQIRHGAATSQAQADAINADLDNIWDDVFRVGASTLLGGLSGASQAFSTLPTTSTPTPNLITNTLPSYNPLAAPVGPSGAATSYLTPSFY